jgi:hypothetical protein
MTGHPFLTPRSFTMVRDNPFPLNVVAHPGPVGILTSAVPA